MSTQGARPFANAGEGDLATSSTGSGMSRVPEGSPGAASSTGRFGREAASPRIEDRYRSLYPLGRGGMGIVEVALEVGGPSEGSGGSFERVVALKRLLPEGKRDKRHTDMFLREARLAALLSHPNVVHAYAFGESNGELFLAMEYIEGEPLSRVLSASRERGSSLDPALTAHVLAEICDGLHAAHELVDERGARLNVVHRDVSPHNVMVAYEGYVKLLDFGVAKIEAEAGLTKTGEVKGKVAYMSPEQAMGDALDRRSDIYSIGACLFECLAGRRMWEGTDMEVLRHLALDFPPRLEHVAPHAPIELCRLYDRLVARDPSARPATAAEVAGELRAFAARSLRRADPEVISPQVIGELMLRLFGEDIERRRVQMEAALRDVAPVDADALRRSIAPREPSLVPPAPTSRGLPAPKPGEASAISIAAVVPKPRRSGLGVLALLTVLLLGGGVAATMYMRAHRPAVLAPSGGGAASADGVDTSARGDTVPGESTTAVVPRTNTIEIESKGAPARARPTPSRPPATKPKGAGSSKVVDVDPNPI